MKPNFALNLSHEGISLLHRAKAGWLSIGEVSLQDPSLVDELGHLRSTAADLETGGMTTKLVIPNSQILYTEVDAPGPSTADRIAQIRDGLVGLTPYDVRDLVFDWRRDGDRAQVAVVARETLQEAESFAAQYRFNPVSFVASPANDAFEGEPFFGPTRHAATLLSGGETIQPDSQSIHILTPGGPAQPPKKQPKPKPKQTAGNDKGDPPGPQAKAQPVAKPAASPASGEPAAASGKAADPAINGAPSAPAEPAFSHRRAEPAAPANPAPEPDPDPTPPVTFASRRANGPVAGTVNASPAPRAKVAPLPKPDLRAAKAAASTPAPKADPLPPARTAAAPTVPPRRTPLPVNAPGTADANPSKPRAKPGVAAKAAGSALAGTLGKFRRGAAKKTTPEPPAPLARNPAPQPIPDLPPPGPGGPETANRPTRTEADAMTVFGARGRQPVRGKPRYLGLVLTLILLLALAVLALWSTYFMSDATSGWFGTFEDEPEIALREPVPNLVTAPPPVRLAPTPVDPAATAPESATPAPDTASTPPDATAAVEPSAIEDAVTSALTAPPDTAAPEPSTETALLEQPPADEPALVEPEPDPPAPVIRRPLTRAEAEARYAATGIWQLDPDPVATPGSDRIEGLVTASVDPRLGTDRASNLPSATALDTDLRPPAPLPPAPLGASFDFDERGVVRATTDGALNPGGIQVFLGAPAYVPGLRPTDLPIPQDDSAAEPAVSDAPQVEVAEQPATPPQDEAAPESEVARLGGFSPDDLAAIRPAIRPASLWTEPETDPDPQPETAATDDEAPEESGPDLSDATDLAVTASAAPAVRPRNFGSIVERALEEATESAPEPRQETETRVAVAAPRAPSIPTRASVAKQATEENAINLSKLNLIGVYGTPANRSALIRLKSGRFVKVEVGDSVDGGRVAAIGNDELRYVKRGRNITLKMPKG